MAATRNRGLLCYPPLCYKPLSRALCYKLLSRASVYSTAVFNRLVAGRVCRKTPRFCCKPCYKKAPGHVAGPMFSRRCHIDTMTIIIVVVLPSIATPIVRMIVSMSTSHDVDFHRYCKCHICRAGYRGPFTHTANFKQADGNVALELQKGCWQSNSCTPS